MSIRYGVFHSGGVGGDHKRSTAFPDDYPSWDEADAAARKATRNTTALCTLVLPLRYDPDHPEDAYNDASELMQERDAVQREVDEMFERPCPAATHGPRNSRCTCEDSRDE